MTRAARVLMGLCLAGMLWCSAGAGEPPAPQPQPHPPRKAPEKADKPDDEITLSAEECAHLVAEMCWLQGFLQEQEAPPPPRPERGPKGPRELTPEQKRRLEERLEKLPPHIRERYERYKKTWEKLSEREKEHLRRRREWLEKLPEKERARVIEITKRLNALGRADRMLVYWLLRLPAEERTAALDEMKKSGGKPPAGFEPFQHERRGPWHRRHWGAPRPDGEPPPGRGPRGPGPDGKPRPTGRHLQAPQVIERLRNWEKLPDAERERIIRTLKLPPERLAELLRNVRNWQDLSQEQREALHRLLQSHFGAPPPEKNPLIR